MYDTLQDSAGYLQRRVSLFSSVAGATFLVLALVDVTMGGAEGEALFSRTWSGSWVPCRRLA